MSVTKAINQNNLGNKVTSRTISWLDLATNAWGSEFRTPDHGVYKWSNGREFDSSDQSKTGIYGVSGHNFLMVADSRYPDMASNSYMLQDNLDKIEIE